MIGADQAPLLLGRLNAALSLALILAMIWPGELGKPPLGPCVPLVAGAITFVAFALVPAKAAPGASAIAATTEAATQRVPNFIAMPPKWNPECGDREFMPLPSAPPLSV